MPRGDGIMKCTTSAQAAAFSNTWRLGDGQPHPLAGDEMLHHWKEPHLPHGVLVVRGLAGGDDPHLVAVVLQRLAKRRALMVVPLFASSNWSMTKTIFINV